MHYVIHLKNYAGNYVRGNERQEGYLSANALVWDHLATCRDIDGAGCFTTVPAKYLVVQK
jgi:hypothetical protein